MKIKHPAKYSDCLLPIFDSELIGFKDILDPFAGTGKLKLVRDNAVLLEIEPEWAAISGGEMSKCKHRDEEFTEEQMARWLRKGIRQTQCHICCRWFWPREWEKKPAKPKTKTFKAWGRFIFCGTQSLKTLQSQTVKQFQCQDKKVFNFDIPCTITIDEKWLKGGR